MNHWVVEMNINIDINQSLLYLLMPPSNTFYPLPYYVFEKKFGGMLALFYFSISFEVIISVPHPIHYIFTLINSLDAGYWNVFPCGNVSAIIFRYVFNSTVIK
jgi:putative flippase GtrA